ncbi:MAG: hypothetical protein OSA84_06315 [Akkermansiaceae bacterium]|nr:hypothetical protein [Akkermansiaceae bacterium]
MGAGIGNDLKLHHTTGKKIRYRGKESNDINHLPMKGGDEGGGAQRLSVLEMSILHSRGARGIDARKTVEILNNKIVNHRNLEPECYWNLLFCGVFGGVAERGTGWVFSKYQQGDGALILS